IKGIPIDVKTVMAGLQGLQKIDFLSVIQINLAFADGFTFVHSVINIHNPSQLTLNIGDLSMVAGWGGHEIANKVGFTQLYGLRLAPGDNVVTSLLGQSSGLPNADNFAEALKTTSPVMTLWANSTATSNPALNAGLASLKTSVVLPKGLVNANPLALPYNDVWTVKILSTTVNDGIIEMTTVFNNPFFHEFTANGEATPEEYMWAQPPQLAIQAPGYSSYSPFAFTQDLKYTLKPGESKTITFKMQLQSVGIYKENMLKFIEGIIPAAAAGPLKTLQVTSTPKLTFPGYPETVYPDYSTAGIYNDPNAVITLQTGPDFPMIKDWYYKTYNVTSTPTPVTPLPETTVTLPTTTSPLVVPTDTLLPTTPTTPTTVEPTVEPTVAPTIAPVA
ncbi:hypothetical protein BGZ47_003305, partial [Haplosporangium gracile]